MSSATAISPTNLALIKYWGKRDTSLNLPINSSISITLDSRELHTITTVSFAPKRETEDKLWVNNKQVPLDSVPRTVRVLQLMRQLAQDQQAKQRPIYIVSKNSFPTAAGLASSASGYSAMVTALAGLFKLDTSKEELSRIARQGSGSASRSLMGGVVMWNMGSKPDGTDSQAELVPFAAQVELEAIICVVSEKKKKVSSTAGMQTSVRESPLLEHRAREIVPKRIDMMKQAFAAGNVESVLELTMRDSNQFHACCLDTFPPIFYMTDISKEIVNLVTELNNKNGGVRYAYTFDAGPNAVVFCEPQHSQALLDALLVAFPPPTTAESSFAYVRGRTELTSQQAAQRIGAKRAKQEEDGEGLCYIFHTGMDKLGARVLQGAEEQERQLQVPQ